MACLHITDQPVKLWVDGCGVPGAEARAVPALSLLIAVGGAQAPRPPPSLQRASAVNALAPTC